MAEAASGTGAGRRRRRRPGRLSSLRTAPKGPDGTLTTSFARSCNTAFIKLIDETKDDAALA
ncbi:hypothetical protein ACWD7T_21400, partial [Streptomyces sp. 900116325]